MANIDKNIDNNETEEKKEKENDCSQGQRTFQGRGIR